jgi:hypothetical protein
LAAARFADAMRASVRGLLETDVEAGNIE